MEKSEYFCILIYSITMPKNTVVIYIVSGILLVLWVLTIILSSRKVLQRGKRKEDIQETNKIQG